MFRANPLPIEPSALERELLHVTGVESAIVTVDEHHKIELIELIADRRANELVRQEVNEILGARWGVEVAADRLVMVDSGERRSRPRPPRAAAVPAPSATPAPAPSPAPAVVPFEPEVAPAGPELVTVSVSIHERAADITAVLAHAGAKATGVATGGPSRPSQRRLVVAAVLDAWAKIAGPHHLELSDVTALRLGEEDVVVTLLSRWHEGTAGSIAGVAVVSAAGELRAVAEAAISGLTAVPEPQVFALRRPRDQQFG